MSMSLMEKLAVNKYLVDEEQAHIIVDLEHPDEARWEWLARACPAGLYRRDAAGRLSFDYAGCLECGACRVLGQDSVVKEWRHPRGGFGIEYRYG